MRRAGEEQKSELQTTLERLHREIALAGRLVNEQLVFRRLRRAEVLAAADKLEMVASELKLTVGHGPRSA